ncbi:phosphonate metabolism protein PhnM, partial [Yersinia pestis PY-09]
MAGYC